MIDSLAALAGAVLVWAAALKLLGRNARIAAQRSGLSRLAGKDQAFAAYRTVGGVELVFGALLLLPPAYPAEAVAAAGLSAGMLGYLTYLRVAAPQSSCGCLGEKHAPVRWRAFARAGVLLAASTGAAFSVRWWGEAMLLDSPLKTVAVLAGGGMLVVVLSAELDRVWLLPLRRWRLRISHPLAGRAFEVPLEATVQQLHKSDAYRSVVGLLRSDLLDSWDEGEWRILTYSARRESGPATAVFAVPRLRYNPELVRVALVDDQLVSTTRP
jgi:Methylamine utilisation protein MauE